MHSVGRYFLKLFQANWKALSTKFFLFMNKWFFKLLTNSVKLLASFWHSCFLTIRVFLKLPTKERKKVKSKSALYWHDCAWGAGRDTYSRTPQHMGMAGNQTCTFLVPNWLPYHCTTAAKGRRAYLSRYKHCMQF